MAQRKAHALILSLPFQGHMNPLLHLSSKLLSAGFMVTFANTQVIHQRIVNSLNQTQQNKDNEGDELLPAQGHAAFLQQRKSIVESDTGDGILHLETNDGGYLRFVSLEDGLPASFEHVGHQIEAIISPAMRALVEALVVRLLKEEHPVTCLVSDVRLLLMQDIANKHALPHLAFWTQSAATFISNLLLATGFQPPPDDSTFITNFPGVPPHKRSEVSALFFDGVRYPSVPDEYLWQPLKEINESEWVVINTYEQLEAPTLDALEEILGFRPLTFGPLIGAPAFSILDGITGSVDEHMDSYMNWLQEHPPASVLYIAFGTVATFSKEQLEELVFGLEASQQPFFWVFRPDLCKNLGSFRVETLFERFRNQGMIVPWAPQWHILGHTSIGGFLTHCGWNSTLEGIKAGVPMLGWPQITDQFVNRRCIEDQWGIGLGLKVDDPSRGLVSRAEVEKKVLNLMQGESGRLFKEKVTAFSNAAKDALADRGSSSLNFEIFLQDHDGIMQETRSIRGNSCIIK